MALPRKRSTWWATFLGGGEDLRLLAVDLLRHAYVREKQQAMRYRQHAERMRYTQFRDNLIRLAQAEDAHAAAIARQLTGMREPLPDVIPVHVAHEQNSWSYLRTDLEEEQRCAGELDAQLAEIQSEFPNVAELLRGIERDGRKHRATLRDMLARSDPQAAAVG